MCPIQKVAPSLCSRQASHGIAPDKHAASATEASIQSTLRPIAIVQVFRMKIFQAQDRRSTCSTAGLLPVLITSSKASITMKDLQLTSSTISGS